MQPFNMYQYLESIRNDIISMQLSLTCLSSAVSDALCMLDNGSVELIPVVSDKLSRTLELFGNNLENFVQHSIEFTGGNTDESNQ